SISAQLTAPESSIWPSGGDVDRSTRYGMGASCGASCGASSPEARAARRGPREGSPGRPLPGSRVPGAIARAGALGGAVEAVQGSRGGPARPEAARPKRCGRSRHANGRARTAGEGPAAGSGPAAYLACGLPGQARRRPAPAGAVGEPEPQERGPKGEREGPSPVLLPLSGALRPAPGADLGVQGDGGAAAVAATGDGHDGRGVARLGKGGGGGADSEGETQ